MPQIISFDDALKQAGEKPSLLIGNGFSIEYFSYQNLLEKADLPASGPERALFKVLDTVDFERVIMALEAGALVERAYKNDKQADAFLADADKIREALVKAVRATHPGHREDIAERIPTCIAFLKNFDAIFTLNYDLLLYWVILDAGKSFQDGFGLGQEKNGFRGPFKTDAHCNVFNVHGGLHLFKTSIGEMEKRLMGASGVIDAIAETITKSKRLPVYVAEGTSEAKLARINSVPYLKQCYDQLRERSGAFFVYGHSAKGNDDHIYDALFSSQIERLFFCVHTPTTKVEVVDGELSRYKKRNGSKVIHEFVDSQTAPVWPAKK